MKKVVVLIIAVMLVAFSANAQKWYKYKNKELKFQIYFPVKPEVSVKENPDGLEMHSVSCRHGLVQFKAVAVKHSGNVEDNDEMEALALDAFSRALNGIVESQISYDVGEHQGIMAKIKSGDGYRIHYGILIDGSRQFQIIILSDGEYAEDATANMFFESFKVK